jgi:hypothetical protein
MIDLHFPNSSRSFDGRNSRVCFWGYDRTNEVCFFVGVDVLQRISGRTVMAEAEMLVVFDGALDRIHKAAIRVYTTGGRGQGRFSYDLTAEDF